MTQLKVFQEKKTRREQIEDNAYMVLSDMAFEYENINGKNYLVVTNLKNFKQKAFFQNVKKILCI